MQMRQYFNTLKRQRFPDNKRETKQICVHNQISWYTMSIRGYITAASLKSRKACPGEQYAILFRAVSLVEGTYYVNTSIKLLGRAPSNSFVFVD